MVRGRDPGGVQELEWEGGFVSLHSNNLMVSTTYLDDNTVEKGTWTIKRVDGLTFYHAQTGSQNGHQRELGRLYGCCRVLEGYRRLVLGPIYCRESGGERLDADDCCNLVYQPLHIARVCLLATKQAELGAKTRMRRDVDVGGE